VSLPINPASLINEMRGTLAAIDKQIVAAKRAVLNQLPVHVEPHPDAVYNAMYPDGKHILTDLLVAKAGLLAAIANLQASTNNKK
jgi:hypothetical protein